MPQHRLYGLRKKAFFAEYKRLYEELRDEIRADVIKTVRETDKFTPTNLGSLCMKFRIPLSVMDKYLEGYFPTGDPDMVWRPYTWDRLRDRGAKARDLGVVWSDDDIKKEED